MLSVGLPLPLRLGLLSGWAAATLARGMMNYPAAHTAVRCTLLGFHSRTVPAPEAHEDV